MKTKKGFLLLESMMGLLVAVSIVSLIVLNIVESIKVQRKQELKIDYYLAATILKKNEAKEIIMHNHRLKLLKVGEKNIVLADQTTGKQITLPK